MGALWYRLLVAAGLGCVATVQLSLLLQKAKNMLHGRGTCAELRHNLSLVLLPLRLPLLLLPLLLLQKAKEMLDSMARVLKPLVDQLAAVETINAPDFLSYSTWLANQAAVKQRWDGE
jgi:hypothetical protein